MKLIIATVLIIITSIPLVAQVGVGTTEPNVKSALDVHSKHRGLLIPRITDVKGASKTEGSLIYDSLNAAFFYCHEDKWYDIATIITEHASTTATLKSTYDKLDIDADFEASGTITADEIIGSGTIPVGGIIMWSGSIATINASEDWALCDGGTKNGMATPNLKGRFIVGYDAGSASLNPASGNLPRQMSDDWIQRPGELANAVGNQQLAQNILNSDYKRVLAKVAPDGSVTYRLIDEDGYVIRGAAGNFNP